MIVTIAFVELVSFPLKPFLWIILDIVNLIIYWNVP